ncbi:MAG TPA: hypothetical protein ENK32_05095 [Anaerolineae bacterium]|nr:hypothetical protein [Anaerolineae bacterium]
MKWQNITVKNLNKGVIRKLKLEPAPKSRRSRERIFWYILDGKKMLRIILPNEHGGSGSVSPGFLQSIRRNLRLNNNMQFVDLVSCSLKPEEYEAIIRDQIDL